ncbi:MAG: hypothetical protein QXT43_02920, partial [Candidatus Micrarchaeaceae archaeon]
MHRPNSKFTMRNRASSSVAGRFPFGAVIALAMGMLVYGVAESYGPVSAIGKVFPQNLAYIAFSLPYIAGGVGALLAGYLADSIGRR